MSCEGVKIIFYGPTSLAQKGQKYNILPKKLGIEWIAGLYKIRACLIFREYNFKGIRFKVRGMGLFAQQDMTGLPKT